MRLAPLVLTLALATTPGAAVADPGDLPTPPPVTTPAAAAPCLEWYGWQTLVADAGAVALGILGAATQGRTGTAFAWTGGGGYVLAAPAIHLGHAQPVRALLSLGMRVGLPVLGALVGSTVPSPPSCQSCDTREATDQYDTAQLGDTTCGALIGALVAMAVDAAALSWKSPDEPAHGPGAAPPAALR